MKFGFLAVVLWCAVLMLPAWAGVAHAADPGRLAAECADLRNKLDHVNAEISALKKATTRGIQGDFRLRRRMADAEALARRLTDAESRLSRARGAGPSSARGMIRSPVPGPEPQDGPIEWEAKADLFADQAQKALAEAGALSRAAQTLRARQILGRRASRLEHDPFAGLDASKRAVVFASPGQGKVPGGGLLDGSLVREPAPAKAATGPAAAPTSTGTDSAPAATASSVTLQYRAWLDQDTLAKIEKQEAAGGVVSSSPEAMEEIAATLRARARALQDQAQVLRARARSAH